MTPRQIQDRVARGGARLLCLSILLLAAVMVVGLYLRARPILAIRWLGELLFSSVWNPARGEFGLAGFIAGSLWVTGLAILIAVPLGLLTAIYLSEYAHQRLRGIAKPVLDVLAGISPVVYGVWGAAAIVPLVRDAVMPWVSERLPFVPFASENDTGFSALSAGIVLAIMVLPILVSVAQEVLGTVPFEVREASLALGATRWETIKWVVLRKARPGLVAAVILGLSRAFGETMAVLMVAGCALQGIPRSIFDPAYPLPALIANTYGEMMSVPLYDAAVLLAALVLLVVTVAFNVVAWATLLRLEHRAA